MVKVGKMMWNVTVKANCMPGEQDRIEIHRGLRASSRDAPIII